MSDASFSVHDWLAKLSPVPLDGLEQVPTESQPMQELTLAVSRLAKQQFRQTHQVQEALDEARRLSESVREESERNRRERGRLEDRARENALHVVEIVDTLDDVSRLVRQRGDAQWIGYMDRLTDRTLQVLASIGVTEVPTTNAPFDASVHQSLDTVAAGPDAQPYTIAEVVQRGFRFNGELLRPAQVITTRP